MDYKKKKKMKGEGLLFMQYFSLHKLITAQLPCVKTWDCKSRSVVGDVMEQESAQD